MRNEKMGEKRATASRAAINAGLTGTEADKNTPYTLSSVELLHRHSKRPKEGENRGRKYSAGMMNQAGPNAFCASNVSITFYHFASYLLQQEGPRAGLTL